MADYFKLPYTELIKQPAWFMLKFQAYLEGKNKAEDAKIKKSKTQNLTPAITNKYKFSTRKR